VTTYLSINEETLFLCNKMHGTGLPDQ